MIAFLTLNAGAAAAALLFAVALGPGAPVSRLVLSTLAGYLVLVHSAVLAAGLARHLTPSGLAVIVGAALAVAAWLFRRRAAGDVGARSGGARPRFTAAALFPPLAAVVGALGWAWPHVVGATRLWVWDDYTYHMVYPALWLREHAIAPTAPIQTFTMQAWYPLSASVVSAWFMAPFGAARAEALAWVGLTGAVWAGLVAAGMVELVGRLGCRRGAWAVPMVLLATSRRIDVMASSFSDSDLAVAAALFGALVFTAPRGDVERGRDVTVDAGYAGLLSGLALGIKVSVAPEALIVLLIATRRAAAPSLPAPARWSAALRTAVIFVVAWAATAGYWYARNLALTGNPLYPAAFLGRPGATFPETTLLEYARRYGRARATADALAVYASWPVLHAALAALGLVALAGWIAWRRRSASRPRRYFALGALAVASTVLVLLPVAPYSAGNAMTFRSGFVHWDSMRYVAVVPILGWTALGALLDAGAGAPALRTVAAIAIACAAWLVSGRGLGATPLLAAVALAAVVLAHARRAAPGYRAPIAVRRALAVSVAMAAMIALVLFHDAKAADMRAAFYREPLFGAAAAVLDRQPPGTVVAVFGDQWIYPAFGDRGHLRPVRLDGDGRIATAPIGDAMAPGDVTVDAATFLANLRASGIDVVVVVHQPHPGRSADPPTQHAALEAAGARLLHRDRAVTIWAVPR